MKEEKNTNGHTLSHYQSIRQELLPNATFDEYSISLKRKSPRVEEILFQTYPQTSILVIIY